MQIDVQHCTFMVDLDLISTEPTELEPAYCQDNVNWETLQIEPFLDATESTLISRLIWIPDWPIIPSRLKRQWGDYCLLRQRMPAPPGPGPKPIPYE